MKPAPVESPSFLTPAEVAVKWGCSPEHVQRLAKRGELRAMKLGRKGWRIAPEAVADFEVRHANEPDSAPELSIPRQPSTQASHAPAVELDGGYALVFKGPVPWRSEVLQ